VPATRTSTADPTALLLRRFLPAAIAILAGLAALRWLASDRGLISQGTGVVLMTLVSIALLTGLAAWSARRLGAASERRRRADRDDLYRLLARSYPNGGTFLFDPELRYVLVEGSALAEVGLSPEAMEGRLIRDVLDADTLETIEPIYRAALAGRTTNFEMPFRGQHYRVTVAPTRDLDGEIVGGVAMTQQISGEVALRDQVGQLQKMEAIGQLAGGVAHDFNNLLVAIRGYTELAQLSPDDERAGEWLDEVLKASEQAASLTKQLLAFSRKQVLQPRPVDLNELVADTEGMLRRVLGERVEMITSLDPELGFVQADPGHVNQVLVNLAVNARDAMPEGGRLTIETSNVALDETYARDHLGAVPGNYALLAVSDTGIGMDRETSARIFEPFFTTKPEGQGTGLGLSTVYGIVTQSNGYISVYSELDWGTVFRIYLPLLGSGDEEQRDDSAEPPPPRRAVGRILVVDDDPGVRGIVETMLHEHGYEADIVADADEAISRCDCGEYDLLLTDMVTPGLHGREIAERAVARNPKLAVLYMSGYTPRSAEAELPPSTRFLAKPFSARELVSAVDEALSSSGTNGESRSPV